MTKAVKPSGCGLILLLLFLPVVLAALALYVVGFVAQWLWRQGKYGPAAAMVWLALILGFGISTFGRVERAPTASYIVSEAARPLPTPRLKLPSATKTPAKLGESLARKPTSTPTTTPIPTTPPTATLTPEPSATTPPTQAATLATPTEPTLVLLFPTPTSEQAAVLAPEPTATHTPTTVPSPTPYRTATPTPTPRRAIAAATANLRSGPGTSFDVVGLVTEGETISVVGCSTACKWYKTDTGNWLLAELVTITAAATPTPTPKSSAARATPLAGKWGVVTADVLNVRAAPDKNATVVGMLQYSDCVALAGRKPDWVQVRLQSEITGWCWGEYITEVATCPTPAPQPVQPRYQTVAAYVGTPLRTNTNVVGETYLHECFGSGESPLRFIPAGTPVEVLGSGLFVPSANEAEKLGAGTFWKIRLWDGQIGWLPFSAVVMDPGAFPQYSGQCEPYDQLDWDRVIAGRPPTPTPVSEWLRSQPVPASASCCKICTKGKACGNTCIKATYTCHVGPGCACNG